MCVYNKYVNLNNSQVLQDVFGRGDVYADLVWFSEFLDDFPVLHNDSVSDRSFVTEDLLGVEQVVTSLCEFA